MKCDNVCDGSRSCSDRVVQYVAKLVAVVEIELCSVGLLRSLLLAAACCCYLLLCLRALGVAALCDSRWQSCVASMVHTGLPASAPTAAALQSQCQLCAWVWSMRLSAPPPISFPFVC